MPSSWGVELVLGILLFVLGVVSLINPLTTLVGIGIVIGVDIVSAGISIIMDALAGC